MRAIVQRVSSASVTVDGQVVGHCGPGFLVLAAAHREDSDTNAAKLADRVVGLRIFNDQDGKMNFALASLPDSGQPNILAVSNFTVYGETSKNRRPSFIESAPYEEGQRLFEVFVKELKRLGARVETGVFGAQMDVELVNNGPVTVIVDG